MGIQTERRVIDSLKGVAILGIVLVHSGCNFIDYLKPFVNNGARGVQIMFLVNGYLIFKSLDNAKGNKITLKQWYIGKAKRIIPLYWLFTILWLIVFGTGPTFYMGPLPKVSWLNILCNMFCLHGFIPYYVGSINLNGFIANLAIWYLIAPLCHKLLNTTEKMVAAFLVVVPVIEIFLTFAEKHSPLSNEIIWKDYLNTIGFLAEFPVILLGCMVYHLIKAHKVSGIYSCVRYACYFFMVFCLALLCIGSNKFYVFSNLFSWGLCFAVIFILQLLHPISLLDNSFFAFFGRYSYGIYLSHMFVIRIIGNLLGKGFERMGQAGQISRYLVICMISVLIAVCVERAYKKVLNHYSPQR